MLEVPRLKSSHMETPPIGYYGAPAHEPVHWSWSAHGDVCGSAHPLATTVHRSRTSSLIQERLWGCIWETHPLAS